MENKLGMVPDFTSDDDTTTSAQPGQDGQVPSPETNPDTTSVEAVEGEKETQSLPVDDNKPDDSKQVVDDTGGGTESQIQIQGLLEEKKKLLNEIANLRGQRREIKQSQIDRVEQQIDELKDVHPEDVSLIDKVLRSKGYITKEESQKMFYKAVQDEELTKFLTKYPEYKPENDPNDLNWSSLQSELKFYRMPDDPHLVQQVLERAHRNIAKISSGRDINIKKQQLKTAGVGGGGVQRSSSGNILDPHKRLMLEQGGWSEEEIKKIEQRL